MRNPTALAMDPIAFLTGIENEKTTREYRHKQVVFSQGDAADAVFYIQSGKVQLTVVSTRGKEAVIGVLETLAAMVGTTRSRVSYFMNRFRKMGFIHYSGFKGGLQSTAPFSRWCFAIDEDAGRDEGGAMRTVRHVLQAGIWVTFALLTPAAASAADTPDLQGRWKRNPELSQDAVSKAFAALALEGRGFSPDEQRFHDALLHFVEVIDSLSLDRQGRLSALVSLDDRRLREPLLLLSVYDRVPAQP